MNLGHRNRKKCRFCGIKFKDIHEYSKHYNEDGPCQDAFQNEVYIARLSRQLKEKGLE